MLTKYDIESIIELGKKFPNNQEFGKMARAMMGEKDFMRETPNDFELGTELRKIIFRKSKYYLVDR
jgi:hypothetical protein